MQGYWKDGRYILASTLEDKLDKAQAEIDRLKKRLEPIERVWEKWKAIRVNFMLDDELTCDLWQAIKEAKEVK